MTRNIVLLIAFLTIYINTSYAQGFFSNVKYQGEVGTYLSTSNITPFWLRSNQYGIIPTSPPLLSLNWAAHKEYDSTKIKEKTRKFGYGYGLNGVVNIGNMSQILLPEAYLKVRYGSFEVYVGRRKEIIGLVDTLLTSGSYIWSGNALPIPKIQISIPNYTSILGHGLLSIKGSFAHGWFGNQTYVKNYYLHQKSLYGRIGKPNWKINLYGGFNSQVQWGGYAPLLVNDTYSSQNGHLPSDFNALMGVAFPLPFVRKAFPPKIKLSYDSENYGGNQLGSVDFAGELKLSQVNILFYRQLPYDLGSLFSSLVNADDGLYGIALKLKKPVFTVNKITIEGFHSYNQGAYRSGIARLLNIKDKHFGELHGYFYHGQYQDGWRYNENIIGSPLMLDRHNETIYNNNTPLSSFNQVKSIYLAMEGKLKKYNYGIKTNYSLYRQAANINQFSFLGYTDFFVRKEYQIKVSVAGDYGKKLKNSSGVSVSVLKNW